MNESGILESIGNGEKNLAILVDPEKMEVDKISAFAKAVTLAASNFLKNHNIHLTHLLVGGSTMKGVDIELWVATLKKHIKIPVVLFPGDESQLTDTADGLLFLNLLSGRNPEYLAGTQVRAAKKLKNSTLEIIPTTYLLIDGGHESAVQRVTNTQPLQQQGVSLISQTAYAGQLMGNRLTYLEAGSGALQPVSTPVVKAVAMATNIPLIVGGGIRTIDTMQELFEHGASMIVVGTAFEENLAWKG
ncbi:MAG: geranylgeranylglyceryl/heptaprenylglyceryl phosphate synthase [Nonlabens sp.]